MAARDDWRGLVFELAVDGETGEEEVGELVEDVGGVAIDEPDFELVVADWGGPEDNAGAIPGAKGNGDFAVKIGLVARIANGEMETGLVRRSDVGKGRACTIMALEGVEVVKEDATATGALEEEDALFAAGATDGNGLGVAGWSVLWYGHGGPCELMVCMG